MRDWSAACSRVTFTLLKAKQLLTLYRFAPVCPAVPFTISAPPSVLLCLTSSMIDCRLSLAGVSSPSASSKMTGRASLRRPWRIPASVVTPWI